MFESTRSRVRGSIDGNKEESEELDDAKSSSSESTQSLISATSALRIVFEIQFCLVTKQELAELTLPEPFRYRSPQLDLSYSVIQQYRQ